jgi:hypothetical protein
MVNPSILSEMRADASEMLGDFGRTFTFKKVRSESTPATLTLTGLLSDPMIATELEIGGLNEKAVFEIRIPSNSVIPSGWAGLKDWGTLGRHLTIIGTDSEFRVMAISIREGSAWVSMRVEAADPMPS